MSGVLSDTDIKARCEDKELFTENYDESCVKQSFYELRAGSEYYLLPQEPGQRPKLFSADNTTEIIIKPFQSIAVMTLETLALPDDIVGHVILKGKFFTVGLIPVSTYADAGFSGKLGIVLKNITRNYIRIKFAEPIAKIEFCKLQTRVSKGYRGQHGYQTEIWPFSEKHVLTSEEIVKKFGKNTLTDEASVLYGNEFKEFLNSVRRYLMHVLLTTVLFFILSFMNFIAVVNFGYLKDNSTYISLVISLLANVIYGVFTFMTLKKLKA